MFSGVVRLKQLLQFSGIVFLLGACATSLPQEPPPLPLRSDLCKMANSPAFDLELAQDLIALSIDAYDIREDYFPDFVGRPYHQESELRKTCWRSVSFMSRTKFRFGLNIDTQVLIAEHVTSGDVAVVFRGTDGLTDVDTDISFRGADWTLPDGMVLENAVHKGFNAAYQVVKEDITLELKELLAERNAEELRVHFSGHSLGGAVATLAALDLAHKLRDEGVHQKNISMYSYGAPRSIARSLYEIYEAEVPHAYAVVNHNDPVAALPTLNLAGRSVDWLRARRPGSTQENPYTHVPNMVVLSLRGAGGSLKVFQERGPGNQFEGCFTRTTSAHDTDRYASRLSRVKAEDVPLRQVKLDVKDGYMRLNWEGDVARCEWVALYRGAPDDPWDWLSSWTNSAWRWATNGNSYRTGYRQGPDYYAGYVDIFGNFVEVDGPSMP